MPDPGSPPPPRTAPAPRRSQLQSDADKLLCQRCGAEMFRMDAVWRCPACRYKADCCGW